MFTVYELRGSSIVNRPSMHPEDIKAALRKKGSSQTDVARRLQVSQATVHLVIHGRGTSKRVASEIAEITGVPLKTLFPNKYVDGRRAA